VSRGVADMMAQLVLPLWCLRWPLLNDVVCMFANDMERSEYIDIADKLADDFTLNMSAFLFHLFVTHSIDGDKAERKKK
jgi:hypothetical protein